MLYYKKIFFFIVVSVFFVSLSRFILLYELSTNDIYVFNSLFTNSSFSFLHFIKYFLPENFYNLFYIFSFYAPLIISAIIIIFIIYIASLYNQYLIGVSVAIYFNLMISFYSLNYLGNINITSLYPLFLFGFILFFLYFKKTKQLLYLALSILFMLLFVFTVFVLMQDILDVGKITISYSLDILDVSIFISFLFCLYLGFLYSKNKKYLSIWIFFIFILYLLSCYKIINYNKYIIGNILYTKNHFSVFDKIKNATIIASPNHINMIINHTNSSTIPRLNNEKDNLILSKILLSPQSYSSFASKYFSMYPNKLDSYTPKYLDKNIASSIKKILDSKKNTYIYLDDSLIDLLEQMYEYFDINKNMIIANKINHIQDSNNLYTSKKTKKMYFAKSLIFDLSKGIAKIANKEYRKINTVFINNDNSINKIIYNENKKSEYAIILYKEKYIILIHHSLLNSFFIQAYLLNKVDNSLFLTFYKDENFTIYKNRIQ